MCVCMCAQVCFSESFIFPSPLPRTDKPCCVACLSSALCLLFGCLFAQTTEHELDILMDYIEGVAPRPDFLEPPVLDPGIDYHHLVSPPIAKPSTPSNSNAPRQNPPAKKRRRSQACQHSPTLKRFVENHRVRSCTVEIFSDVKAEVVAEFLGLLTAGLDADGLDRLLDREFKGLMKKFDLEVATTNSHLDTQFRNRVYARMRDHIEAHVLLQTP